MFDELDAAVLGREIRRGRARKARLLDWLRWALALWLGDVVLADRDLDRRHVREPQVDASI